jgi:pSer/pThr/pTyr-binding forkhead associated (FHA) protein
MGALAWVEVLDAHGHVRARHRIDAVPAIIGRGYGCDVLLDDPWVSPVHARLYRDLDGSFVLEDAGSENGL